ncbi:aminodeoxychorismate synthase component I [bacterium M00.F.Ca.ET.228.01.1.1]|uniref:aminodeoxychorismate synthase component I n=1 Tax=Paraburkholderia phenoliruptrix TaxID=252970 RepID=UPI0010925AC6|nr:aminodeoxychorismate synthase component I [Paraburkholderia phenoliruptrix]TGP41991.1 aminodeoxychorismate synthase component I [bacterium M00.F.Ca.ET.228.01.1.1]TGR99423.1 aminodeoxychorismate synthase component I [bacterium M00.F.Ca.ET.191.01.1.1]TGU03789.1 aminodeoxychorismate synthase component I [bacterium M00.F.Ca.ET.155.01.1.1]MBW0449821.1 aminodeoxychorismate synthase component I [Paraburkholderia phenoliruptrix]MBW9099671.1 aminodeoxychorismate synthase component I [Paraburkholderi
MTADERGAVFALLDDCDASAARRSSRLYTGFVHEHVCADAAPLEAVCEAAQADARSGLFAVVLADYEFGRHLLGGASAPSLKTQHGNATLRFLLFERCEKLSRDEVDAWLVQQDGGLAEPSAAGTANVRESVEPQEFNAAIGAIHAALRAGDSYQVNYTYRLSFDVFGTPAALYRRLRARQPVRYGALIALPGGAWVLSCSPELFVEKQGANLRARPMKGTAPRCADPATDRAAAEFLRSDPKNRAENVMIVDLLRNDLSRVAQTGTVKVPALFSVEPYASVWQMTSTVQAALRPGTSFAAILRALFPCGSITGAPKHRTMQLIDAIESTPRGLYTGAIGWLDAAEKPGQAGAGEQACGDFCMSVAIRTLTLEPSAQSGLLRGTMGIGAGIVLDSIAEDEYAECRLKARFLTGAEPGFELFETMYATREAGVRHLSRHLARLSASAATFGFAFDEQAVRAQIAEKCASLPPLTPHRMRLALGKSGATQITAAVLTPLAESSVGVLLATEHGFAALQAGDPLLRHKTTRRAEYDRGWREAEARGAFDTLFFNERGELTEGGRSNVFVKLDGRWWTPPLDSGVLPGVMRGVLLEEDTSLQAAEKVLTQADVLNAQALMICNALRGAMPARLVH